MEELTLRVFENRMIWRIFGPKKDEVEKMQNLCSSPNIIKIIKSRRMRWTGHEARKGEIKMNFGWEA
jgi:hypothetical protein